MTVETTKLFQEFKDTIKAGFDFIYDEDVVKYWKAYMKQEIISEELEEIKDLLSEEGLLKIQDNDE